MKSQAMKKKMPNFKKWFACADSDKKNTRICTVCENFFHFFLIFIFYVISPPAKQTKYSGLGKCADCFVIVNLTLFYVMHWEVTD